MGSGERGLGVIVYACFTQQLCRIFKTASHRNAIILDEADVFLEQRWSENIVPNSLVAVFFRKLEYCQGIFFLNNK